MPSLASGGPVTTPGAANWLFHMVNTQRPLEEKMALFWHHVFATGNSKVDNDNHLIAQIDMWRDHGTGNYRDLLIMLAQKPGHDLLARQPRKPQARAQRKLGPRTTRTVLPRRRPLHRKGRLRVRPRLHRLDNRPQNAARPQPPLLLPVRVPPRRARLRRENLPRPHRQLRRPQHHRHHPRTARLPAFHLPTPLQLLRRRRNPGARLEHRTAAQPGGHRVSRRRLRRLRLRAQAGPACALQRRLLQGGDVREGQEPRRGRRRHAPPDQRPTRTAARTARRRSGIGAHGPEPAQPRPASRAGRPAATGSTAAPSSAESTSSPTASATPSCPACSASSSASPPPTAAK